MTSTPSSAALREAGSQSTPRSRPNASRRRDKPQLSCDLCRRRKLRCDRLQPCSTCSSRGQPCTYPEESAPPLSAVHHRLEQLERLVMSMASKPNTNLSVNSSDFNALTGVSSVKTLVDGCLDRGIMHSSPSQMHYVGGNHWAAILDGIAELKDHLNHQEQVNMANSPGQELLSTVPATYVDSWSASHSLLLYGGSPQHSHEEMLATLPPKATIDRHLSRYFHLQELVSSAVHGPTFLQEYESFWNNPSALPIAWLGLLFGIICLSVLAAEPGDFAPNQGMEQQAFQVGLYREKISQCLILGEYTQAGPYVLEAMIHYVYIEFASRADANKDIWFLLALEVNLAKRMGCHRDPSNFPGLKPLESEMRRRLWATVVQGDILISSQMGMPRMVSDWQCDTAEPRNLHDADLHQDLSELPVSRPETEITTTLGLIARKRILAALGTISDITASVKPCDYTEVMRAEAILQEAAASLPEPFKMKPMTASLADPPQVVMSRLFISHLFYKGLIMLHRRYVMVPVSTDDASVTNSRKACLEASLAMLRIQHVLYEETQPGGRLDMMRWRVSSMINHQFLTATMMLCSFFYHDQTLERDEEVLTVLRGTRSIWRTNIVSTEAAKAADAIDFVMARAEQKRHGDGRNGVESVGSAAPSNGMSAQNNEIEPGLSGGNFGMVQNGMDFYNLNRSEQSGPQSASSFNFSDSGTVPTEWLMLGSNGTMW